MADRIAEQKSVITAFAAEHALPYALIPDLLAMSKRLSEDKKALLKTSMGRTSATYTSTHGLAAGFKEELNIKLRESHFSLNIDEATDNAMDKIVNMVVNYYDKQSLRITMQHLASVKVNIATAENIFKAVKQVLEERAVPMTNLVSCLMDNCATMRGCRSGVETLLRKETSAMLDVAGDTVHTVANAAKALFEPFKGYVEDISMNIYYDIEKSPKVKELFNEVQELLGISNARTGKGFLHVLRPCPSRFLQMLDVSNRLAVVMDVLLVYYYSFLTKEEQQKYRSLITSILTDKAVTDEAAARIQVLQKGQRTQLKSSCSDQRKNKIITALFANRVQFNACLGLYRGLLPKFQGYVKKFQADKPQMHQQHADMFFIVRDFLALFIKREHVPDTSVKALKTIEVASRKVQLPDKRLCVGQHAYATLDSALQQSKHSHWVNDVFEKLRKGYVNAATMLINKLPLENKTICLLSSLDPKMVDDSSTASSFVDLGKMMANVIPAGEVGALDVEARSYTTDKDVSTLAFQFGQKEEGRIDQDFWSHVFDLRCPEKMSRYPQLQKLVKAALTIFTGPMVESTFNIMDDIIRADRTCLAVENYEATAIIKSALAAKAVHAFELVLSPTVRREVFRAKSNYTAFMEKKKQKHKEELQQRLEAAVRQIQGGGQKRKSTSCSTSVPAPAQPPQRLRGPTSTSASTAATRATASTAAASITASTAATSTTASTAASRPAATNITVSTAALLLQLAQPPQQL